MHFVSSYSNVPFNMQFVCLVSVNPDHVAYETLHLLHCMDIITEAGLYFKHVCTMYFLVETAPELYFCLKCVRALLC